MVYRKIILAVLVVWVIIWHLWWRKINHDIATPDDRLIEDTWQIQIRELPSMITASVVVSGDLDQATSAWFRPLAWFIFWDNTVRGEIAMTAPVTAQQTSTTIDMTAPVTASALWDEQYEISFMMPAERTIDNLPVPNNDTITIRETDPTQIAVWRFSGYANASRSQAQLALFLTALDDQDISREWSPTLAQYNDPRTPPRMRRNERWVSVK